MSSSGRNRVPTLFRPFLYVAQIRVVADETETAVNWAEMGFRLSKVRDGSHKDCWLMERVIITDSGYDAKEKRV